MCRNFSYKIDSNLRLSSKLEYTRGRILCQSRDDESKIFFSNLDYLLNKLRELNDTPESGHLEHVHFSYIDCFYLGKY